MVEMRFMGELVYRNYFGEKRQKVGKMYTIPPIEHRFPRPATKFFVENAQKTCLYDFSPAWDTDFIISSGFDPLRKQEGTPCREK